MINTNPTEMYLGMPSEKIIAWCKEHYGPADLGPLCFTAQESGATVGMVAYNELFETEAETFMDLETTSTPEVESSWTKYLGQIIYLDQCQGNKVYFRAGDAGNPHGVYNDLGETLQYFVMSDGKVAASGNIMYLLTKDGTRTSMIDNNIEASFFMLFYGCIALTQAPALPATTLAADCYNSMFNGCTALTQAPALPATTLTEYCYFSMFNGCTALTQAPALPATTLAEYCYLSMFNGCTKFSTCHMKTSIKYPDNPNGYQPDLHGDTTKTVEYDIP